ncbi:Hypp9207 [Branchiostoma lanceolatum]|uniref:Hypp9207 protein n=1 Tax=Branchiostoma lanceolatum TaxID=7740 RepID=A0A8K0EGA7_BRALA|nr:Hypp9207 [Branchiostoma lanceolatum]
MEKAWSEDECNYNCKAGGGNVEAPAECRSTPPIQLKMSQLKHLPLPSGPCEGRRELEVLSELTDTLDKLENAFKREMGETGDFEEEMRELEDTEADNMFEVEE